MKQKILFLFSIALLCSATFAQNVKPVSCTTEHSDSCWYVTMNYHIDEMPKNDELILVTQICCPDTCVHDSARRFQGKRYARRYKKEFGEAAGLMPAGMNSFTMVIPEDMVTDTLVGVTYSEYTTPDGTVSTLDTVEIILPMPASLSCRPVKRLATGADKLAMSKPYVSSIRNYQVLDGDSVHIPTNPTTHVHFAMNSPQLEGTYLNNAETIEELISTITELTQDSDSEVESIHIVGYTSPDVRDEIVPKLGYKRANALCSHLQKECNLPDSVFEIADGGKHWHHIYTDIAHSGIEHSDSLVRKLQNEKNPKKRLALLRKFNNGKQYSALCNDSTATNYRGACCTRIYYHNLADSTTQALNEVVNELAFNPNPDYDKLRQKLAAYGNDPRALNIRGVIDHRQHRRAAASQAFRQAAALGDKQAETNLAILGLSMD